MVSKQKFQQRTDCWKASLSLLLNVGKNVLEYPILTRLPCIALARIPEKFIGGGIKLKEFKGLMHVSDIKPTLLGFVEESKATYAADFFTKGEGYNMRNALLGLTGGPRMDVLMSYDKTTNVLAYRFKKWKLISGHRGDTKKYEEPTSDSQWVGNCLTDYVAEMIMHFQHWFNEDASGTLDESVRGRSPKYICSYPYWLLCLS